MKAEQQKLHPRTDLRTSPRVSVRAETGTKVHYVKINYIFPKYIYFFKL